MKAAEEGLYRAADTGQPSVWTMLCLCSGPGSWRRSGWRGVAGLCLEDCPWPVHRALGVWSLGEAVLCPLHRQGCVPGKSAGPVLNGERAWCWALAAGIRLSPALTSAPHVEQHRLVPPLVAGRVLPTVLDLWGPWVLTQRARGRGLHALRGATSFLDFRPWDSPVHIVPRPVCPSAVGQRRGNGVGSPG